jgi:hypothetical protein
MTAPVYLLFIAMITGGELRACANNIVSEL